MERLGKLLDSPKNSVCDGWRAVIRSKAPHNSVTHYCYGTVGLHGLGTGGVFILVREHP